jgi:hypothetical protein
VNLVIWADATPENATHAIRIAHDAIGLICFFIYFLPFRDSRCDRSVNAGCYKYAQDEGFERFLRSAKKQKLAR